MDMLSRIATSAMSHVVLLLVVLPAFGSVLVRLMRRTGRESAYYTAVTNVWTGLSLAVLMLAGFLSGSFEGDDLSSSQPQDRMVSSIVWHSELQAVDPSTGDTSPTQRSYVAIGPDVRVIVGVSGMSVWLIILTVAVTVIFVQSQPQDHERLIPRLSWVLLTEAALIGTLAALDIVLLSFCTLLSVVGLSMLIAEFGGRERRQAARRFFIGQLASGLLLMSGLIGLAMTHWWMQVNESAQHPDLTFSLTTMVRQIPVLSTMTEPALDFWNTLAPWLFLIIAAGLFLRVPFPPLHHGWLRVAEHTDRRVVALIAVGYLPAAMHLLLRLVLPVFSTQSIDLGYRLLVWGTVAAVILALVAAATRSRQRRLAAAGLSVTTIAIGASFLQLPGVVHGAALATIGTAVAFAVAVLCPATPHILPGSKEDLVGKPPGFGTATRNALSTLSFAGLSLVPPTAGFWGALLIVEGLYAYDSTIALCLLPAFALIGWTMWDEFVRWAGGSCENGTPSGSPTRHSGFQSGEPDEARLPGPTLLPLAAVLIGVSVFPATVLDHLSLPASPFEDSGTAQQDQPDGASPLQTAPLSKE